MRLTLYIISIILFGIFLLICIYEEKLGQIKLRDSEIPFEEINFRRSNILWINKLQM